MKYYIAVESCMRALYTVICMHIHILNAYIHINSAVRFKIHKTNKLFSDLIKSIIIVEPFKTLMQN